MIGVGGQEIYDFFGNVVVHLIECIFIEEDFGFADDAARQKDFWAIEDGSCFPSGNILVFSPLGNDLI